jgi:hypothetical protein
MPQHDPVPRRRADYERAAAAWQRFRRSSVWMIAATVVMVGLSLLYLKAQGGPMPWSLVITVAAGVGLTMLVGTGLMGLIFLSHRSGHDDDAAHGGQDD